MVDWLFDGLGTEIVILILSLLSGTVIFHAGIKNRNKQVQKAGKGSIQKQVMQAKSNGKNKNLEVIRNNQYQKAGKNSKQEQYGDVKNG